MFSLHFAELRKTILHHVRHPWPICLSHSNKDRTQLALMSGNGIICSYFFFCFCHAGEGNVRQSIHLRRNGNRQLHWIWRKCVAVGILRFLSCKMFILMISFFRSRSRCRFSTSARWVQNDFINQWCAATQKYSGILYWKRFIRVWNCAKNRDWNESLLFFLRCKEKCWFYSLSCFRWWFFNEMSNWTNTIVTCSLVAVHAFEWIIEMT